MICLPIARGDRSLAGLRAGLFLRRPGCRAGADQVLHLVAGVTGVSPVAHSVSVSLLACDR